MSLHKLADEAVVKINKSLEGRLSEPEIEQLTKIVQETLVVAVNESTKQFNNAAVVCCGPEADIAHKIAEDVERARFALLANMTSAR